MILIAYREFPLTYYKSSEHFDEIFYYPLSLQYFPNYNHLIPDEHLRGQRIYYHQWYPYARTWKFLFRTALLWQARL